MQFLRKFSVAIVLSLMSFAVGIATFETPVAYAQATAVNGSIQGTITDPSGAAIPSAEITIVSVATGASKVLHTDNSGFYTSGPLIPGEYVIDATATGFAEVKSTTRVQIGVATNGNLALPVAKEHEVVEVHAGAIQVNTEQSSVNDVLTTEQIESLPVNGRNFLDLAQLEPGVQLQSGESFDPTKAGYSAISFSGVSGRTTRILLDGQDITDETVGTTILNVSEGAIDQFQMSRSNSDVSGEIGSSGQVSVSTRSGSNQIHGQVFGNFQDNRAGFAAYQGIDAPFQRDQFGGNIGGPILKDKLFLFANAERIKQAESGAVAMGSLFAGIQSAYPTIPAPYKLTYSTGRLDYNGPWGVHYFARLSYDVDALVGNFGLGYSNYANRDNTPAIAGGADFVHGQFTHSIRGSYEKFHNMIADASGSGVFSAYPGLNIRYVAQGFYTGPNPNAPQGTFQSDKQLRYDGSWTKSAHNLRYGVSLNRILQGGFASFFGLGPRVSLNASAYVGPGAEGSVAITPDNFLSLYSANTPGIRFGNGFGYFTTKAGFGLPAGISDDWRVGLYVGDTWKLTPRFTLNAGLRYQRDTGRTDNWIDPIPCSEINADNFLTVPCSGDQRILDQFGPGLGDRIMQPDFDFAPQIGVAYRLDNSGKTVVRAAVGVFRENNVFNAVQFDTPFKLKEGLFNDYSHTLCGGTYKFSMPGTGVITSWNGETFQTICAQPLSVSASKIVALQAAYQAATAAGGAAGNSSFIGNRLAIPGGNSAYAPNYKTPYSIHMNVGVQREIASGMVFSADFVHQVTNRIAQNIDVNHVGDAQFLNTDAAQLAIAYTLDQFEANSIDEAIANGATIFDFANNGLDSGNVYLAGYPASYYGATPAEGAAFPGRNANVGNGFFSFPAGRSVYDALQLNLREQKSHPVPGIVNSNLEVSYAYGRFLSTSGGGSDQFFGGSAWDYNHPNNFMGYGGLDHRHNLAFGGSVDVKYGPRVALIAHFLSPGATSLILDDLAGSIGQIFVTDVTGDGTIADLLPGTKPGAYGRSIHGGDVKGAVNNYNSKYAGTLTPAGQQVVSAGLFTAAQMTQLGGVQQEIAAPPSSVYENPIFKSVDLSFSYPVRLKFINEVARLEPVVAIYNAFNLANYGGPEGVLLNTADAGSDNYVNGNYNFDVKNSNRTGRGSGTFDQGGPRSIEFQMKFTF